MRANGNQKGVHLVLQKHVTLHLTNNNLLLFLQFRPGQDFVRYNTQRYIDDFHPWDKKKIYLATNDLSIHIENLSFWCIFYVLHPILSQELLLFLEQRSDEYVM